MADETETKTKTKTKTIGERICEFWKEHRNYIFGLIVWAFACLLFSKPINTYLGKLGSFLFEYERSLLYDILIIIVLAISYFFRSVIRGFLRRFRDFKNIGWKTFCIVLVWYIPMRFFHLKPEIDFISLRFFPILKLMDILLVGVIIILIVHRFKLRNCIDFKRWRDAIAKKNKRMKESSFITDVAFKPSKEKQEDLLGFAPYAERIAREAMYITSNESVVFGINGQWGEGKTSMINLVKKELKAKKYNYVDFHPWRTTSGKATTQLFFDALKEGLNGKIVGINGKINRYAEALLQLDNSGIGKTLWQLIVPVDSVETQKDQLWKAMQQLDKNLIVFVDDLDRLAKHEIADVLKLMRDTANFPNLVFIAAYDRNYLNKAIKDQICEHEYETYLDKIVLWEFKMPNIYKEEKIRLMQKYILDNLSRFENDFEKLFKFLNDNVSVDYMMDNIIDSEESKQLLLSSKMNIHDYLFHSIRVVKRFVNKLAFNTFNEEQLSDEKYYLTLLEFFYPNEFDNFVRNHSTINAAYDTEENRIKFFNEQYNYIQEPGRSIVSTIVDTILSKGKGSGSLVSFVYSENLDEYMHRNTYIELGI